VIHPNQAMSHKEDIEEVSLIKREKYKNITSFFLTKPSTQETRQHI